MTIKIVQSKFLKDGMTVSFNTTTSQMVVPRWMGTLDLLTALIAVVRSIQECIDCSVHIVTSLLSLRLIRVGEKKNCKERQLETLETCVTQTDAQFFVNICKNNKRRFDLQIKIYLQKAKLLLIKFFVLKILNARVIWCSFASLNLR